ncbi:MAG: PQQ-dependent sugar dehydrogenase, partial [Planctomycetaceae bacterium]
LLTNGPVKAENKQNRISRFTMQRDGQRLVAADSELVILEWDSNGHNGGDLAFGPDGYLYCPTGDGTSDSDPLQTGQGVNDLLAVMLRLDVDRPTAERPYSIPPDNPYVDVAGARPEIWAYGFRNPWRMAYDWQSNQLWVGQNGQDL